MHRRGCVQEEGESMKNVIDDIKVCSYNDGKWLAISIDVVRQIVDARSNELPEDCFLQELHDEAEDVEATYRCQKCETCNDDDAKFCKECGTRLDMLVVLTFGTPMWAGDDSWKTFSSIFVENVVPHIKGDVTCCITYGDEDDSDTPWFTAYFRISAGTITWITPTWRDDDVVSTYISAPFMKQA